MSLTHTAETRRILLEARELATEVFGTPSEGAVIAVFQRLCFEVDLAGTDLAEPERHHVH